MILCRNRNFLCFSRSFQMAFWHLKPKWDPPCAAFRCLISCWDYLSKKENACAPPFSFSSDAFHFKNLVDNHHWNKNTRISKSVRFQDFLSEIAQAVWPFSFSGMVWTLNDFEKKFGVGKTGTPEAHVTGTLASGLFAEPARNRAGSVLALSNNG